MNANQLIKLVMRLVMDSGIRHWSNKGRDPKDMTPDERAAAKRTRQNANRARQAMNTLRRFGRR